MIVPFVNSALQQHYMYSTTRIYATGQRVTDKQLAEVNLEPDAWHGEWNYTIHPNDETNHES